MVEGLKGDKRVRPPRGRCWQREHGFQPPLVYEGEGGGGGVLLGLCTFLGPHIRHGMNYPGVQHCDLLWTGRGIGVARAHIQESSSCVNSRTS